MSDPAQPFPSRFAAWKEALPFIVAAFGVLYGVGWAIQYQSVTGLGVGPITVPREKAIATALALGVAIVPGLFYAALLEFHFQERKTPYVKYWSVAILVDTFLFAFVSFFLYYVPLSFGKASPELIGSALALLVGQGIFSLSALLMRSFHPNYKLAFVFGPLLALAFSISFAQILLPKLPESVGGFGRSRVHLNLKDPPERVAGTLAASDDAWIILTDADPMAHASGKTLRVPQSRIVDIHPWEASCRAEQAK